MTSDHHINGDSVLHEYEYEQDSDLDDEEEGDSDNIGPQRSTVPGLSQTGSLSKSRTPGNFSVFRCSGFNRQC